MGLGWGPLPHTEQSGLLAEELVHTSMIVKATFGSMERRELLAGDPKEWQGLF